MGFREGAMRFAIANLPTFGVFFHSICHSLVIAFLVLRLAFDLVVLKGISHLCVVASLARVSALSLPGMPQWLGHHATVKERFGCVSRRGRMWLWKLRVKYWAGLGLGSRMALTAAALSEKKVMFVRLGWVAVRLEAIEAPLASAAISASNTSAWPPSPSLMFWSSCPRW